jgi:Sel1 repeat
MSSPVHHAKDLNDALKYAPPWVRDDARAATLVPGAAKIEWPPRNRRSGAGGRMFSGDVAVRELQRQVALHPQRVPEPVSVKRNRPGMRLALRIGAAICVAALTAWAIVWLPTLWQGRVDAGFINSVVTALTGGRSKQDQLTTGAAAARLLVHDGRVQANELLPAGIELEGNQAGTTVVLFGLAPDTRLSAGSPFGTGGWRLDAGELEDLQVQPPRDFVGSMNVKVDLRLADDHLADSQMVHLEWTRPPEAPPVTAPRQAPPQPDAIALHLDAAEIATLLKRGQDFLKNGDLVAARLLLQRAAAAGSAAGAFELGQTFDPAVIEQLGAMGVRPDVAKAREWYQKAAQLGSDVASQQLAKLAQGLD